MLWRFPWRSKLVEDSLSADPMAFVQNVSKRTGSVLKTHRVRARFIYTLKVRQISQMHCRIAFHLPQSQISLIVSQKPTSPIIILVTLNMADIPKWRRFPRMTNRLAADDSRHLLNIPAEIRLIVYSYLATPLEWQEFEMRSNNTTYQLRPSRNAGALVKLSRTCNKMRFEVQDFLLNNFQFKASIVVTHFWPRQDLDGVLGPTGLWRNIECSPKLFLGARSIVLRISMDSRLRFEHKRALDLLCTIASLMLTFQASKRLCYLDLELEKDGSMKTQTRNLNQAMAITRELIPWLGIRTPALMH